MEKSHEVALGAQAGQFQREDRYIVIKRKDLEAIERSGEASDLETHEAVRFLAEALDTLRPHLPARECLVIESDWPEYEPAWDAIQARVEARAALATQPAAGEPVAKPDSSDTFYAGLYHKSSPMWHQLHELAVSKGYDHVRYAIECAPVYKCDCRGARKVGLDLEGRTRPCECVEAANDALVNAGSEAEAWQMRSTQSTSWMNCEKRLFDGIRKDPKLNGVYEVRELFAAPPAAAHGDEAVRKDAERYRWLREDAFTYERSRRKFVAIEDFEVVPGDFADGAEAMDATIDAAMRAQAGEGGEV